MIKELMGNDPVVYDDEDLTIRWSSDYGAASKDYIFVFECYYQKEKYIYYAIAQKDKPFIMLTGYWFSFPPTDSGIRRWIVSKIEDFVWTKLYNLFDSGLNFVNGGDLTRMEELYLFLKRNNLIKE